MPLPRKLEFKDRFVERLVQEIPYACSTEPILFPDNETPIKFMVELSQNEFTALLSAVLTGADLSYPERSHEVVWSLLKLVECPVDICEVLTDCLQPLFDEINTKLDSIQSGMDAANEALEEVQQNLEENAAKPTELPEIATSDVYAGALALVQEMDRQNRKLYAEAEASFVDNAAEWISQILDVFPKFSAQGVNAGAELANAYFENQVANYEADYEDFEEPAACSLYCYIIANDDVLTYDVWGDWLNELEALFPGGNAAAAVYAKYSPLRQTFLNQIAALFNQDQSLQSYFDNLWNAYYTGTTNPIPVPPECECPGEWCIEIDASNGLDTLFEPSGGLGPQAAWTGTGWGANNAVTVARVTLHGDLGEVVDFHTIEMDFDIAPLGGNEDQSDLYSNEFGVIIDSQPNGTTIILSNDAPRQAFELDVVTSSEVVPPDAVPILGEIQRIRLKGFGVAPGIGTPC